MIEYSLLSSIIEWATDAGRQEALVAAHESREVDSRGGMGLWQAFQAKFPKSLFEDDMYDEAITLYSIVYTKSAESCYKAIKGDWS